MIKQNNKTGFSIKVTSLAFAIAVDHLHVKNKIKFVMLI
jgi:hypothetical protein